MTGTAGRTGSAERPWRSPPVQAQLVAALLDRSPDSELLGAWLGQHGAAARNGQLQTLLPLAFARLLETGSDAEIVEQARAAFFETSRLNMARVTRLLAVLGRFSEEGIPAVVLKGAALILRYYRSYGARPMADVDVLVRPSDVGRAAALLRHLGWTTPAPRSEAELASAMRVHHAWAFYAPPFHNLDLHWRVLNVTSPEVEVMFWEGTELLEVAAAQVRVLNPADQIFHVCAHAVQPAWTPSPAWMIDVAAILDATGAVLDWARFVDTARRTNTSVRHCAAIADLNLFLGDRIPAPVLDALDSIDAPGWERREFALFSRMPPFRRHHLLRWHWYQFKRRRAFDDGWAHRPTVAGFADYVRLKLQLNRLEGR